MFHTVCYGDSTSAAQTDTDMPALNDPSTTILNNHFIFPGNCYLQWIYGLGLTMTRLRLSAPRLRPIARPVINPVDQAATPTENLRIMDYWRHPLMLNGVEELSVLRTNTTAVAERDWALVTVGDNQRNVQQGDMYTMRATTSFTPTVAVWTAGVITNDDTLQVGRYSIVGLRVNNSGGVGARLIFPGAPIQGQWPQIRPGVKVDQSNATEGIFWTRFGIQGEYGQFESFAAPQLEVMAAVATANPEVIYDIINVRQGARAQ